MHRVVFPCVIIFFGLTCVQESTGDTCDGECKLITNCSTVITEESARQVCGLEHEEIVICCPAEAPSTIPPADSPPTIPPTESPSTIPPAESPPAEISKQKCREYSKFVYERKKPPILLIDAEDTVINRCGHKVVELIVGGELAKRMEFPHMAALGYNTGKEIGWLCAGTIISETFILTAGHCLRHRKFGLAQYALLGVTNLSDKGHKQRLKIAEHISHPDYNPISHYNDIGLLKLQSAIKLNPYARPACLNQNFNLTARKAIATGWGTTSYRGNFSEDLLKVTLDLFDNPFCNHSFRNQISIKLKMGIIENMQICAGSIVKELDTCQGDSGGPLQIFHIEDDIECMYDVIGVTSFGKACGGSPGVYMRVSTYIKWIEDIVWPS